MSSTRLLRAFAPRRAKNRSRQIISMSPSRRSSSGTDRISPSMLEGSLKLTTLEKDRSSPTSASVDPLEEAKGTATPVGIGRLKSLVGAGVGLADRAGGGVGICPAARTVRAILPPSRPRFLEGPPSSARGLALVAPLFSFSLFLNECNIPTAWGISLFAISSNQTKNGRSEQSAESNKVSA